jgi:hypothetical protein
MIDRELLNEAQTGDASPKKVVRRNLGAGGSRVPVIAALPAELERRKVVLPKPLSGESWLKTPRQDAVDLGNRPRPPSIEASPNEIVLNFQRN